MGSGVVTWNSDIDGKIVNLGVNKYIIPYKLVVTDWSTDYRRDTIIKIPSFILEENWCNDVESQRINSRINEIDKEINRIEVIMASGTGQIMELNKEKEELEIKLRKLK